MRYYIADCHFFHENLIHKMDHRPFRSMEDMNEYMLEKWNKKVRKNDDVVILGDLSFGTVQQTNELLVQLNGRLYLIKGNHDSRYLGKPEFRSERFIWIRDYAELNDNKKVVVLSHYPMLCYNGQYRKDPEGNPKRYMLYGHVHNTQDEQNINRFIRETRESYHTAPDGIREYIPCNMINCFCMFSDYEPLTLDEWIQVDETRRKIIDASE